MKPQVLEGVLGWLLRQPPKTWRNNRRNMQAFCCEPLALASFMCYNKSICGLIDGKQEPIRDTELR